MDRLDYHVDGAFRDWPRRPVLSAVAVMYFAAAAGIVLMQALAGLIYQLAPSVSRASVFSMVSLAYHVCALFLPVTRYAQSHPGAALGMRLKRPAATGVVIAALAAVVGVMLAGNVGTLWALVIEALGGRLSDGSAVVPAMPMAAQLLFAALLPAVCEEWMFRGAVLSAWERYGTCRALAASTLLFVSLHGSIEGLPVQLMVGFALGLIVVATDSVVTGMIYHALHNALLLLLSGGGARVPGERLYDYLGGAREVWMTALRAGTLGLVYAGLLAAIWYTRARAARPKPPFAAAAPMEPWTMIVLGAGVVTAACLYLIDLLAICGVNL